MADVGQHWHSSWNVRGDMGLTLDSSWRVLTSVGQTWDSAWDVKDIDPVGQHWHSAWLVGVLVGAHWHSAWIVARRSHMEGETEVIDDVEAYAQLNGVDLNNRTTTFLMSGIDLGQEGIEYDTVRHYDASLVVHDVRDTLVDMTIPVKIVAGDPDELNDIVATIRAAANAGGTFAYQDGGPVPGLMQTFTVVPSPGPEPVRDHLYALRNVAIYDIRLTRFPRT